MKSVIGFVTGITGFIVQSKDGILSPTSQALDYLEEAV
ncbi:hypothetical protein VCHA54P501_230075 [Vibrio chagasii]|nr:hypothetical protein VCHA54P501_230075 [Vibrio chagasii]